MEIWRPLVTKYFGKDTDKALKVMECESQGDSNAIGDGHLKYIKNGIEYGASYGLFQIRAFPKRPFPSLDPEENIKQAYGIFKHSGFNPWTCKRVLTK